MKANIKEAKEAMQNAYAPYSNFKVGAAIELKDGTIIKGANMENNSYTLGTCAERTALFTTYAMGYRKEDIVSITVIGDTENPISPCGACRQVMSEYLTSDAKIYLTNLKENVKETNTVELLPYGFVL